MPDSYTSLSILVGLVSVMINIFQYIRDKTTRRTIIAAKGNFDAISDLCKNALRSDALVKNTEAIRQVLTSVRYMARSGNNSLDTLLSKRKSHSIQEDGNGH